ncbi:MAG: NAD(P)H-hydrate dehydratase [Candidatus Altiarchaeota archaeon]
MDSRAVDVNCEYLGIDRLLLMENAGREIASKCKDFDRISIFCGLGNNGGDGLAAARHLASMGKKVRVYALEGRRKKECQANYDILRKLDIELTPITDSSDCQKLEDSLRKSETIIDALIGVGITGSLREPVKSIVKLINRMPAKKISVDAPTGDSEDKIKADTILSLDTPKVEGATVIDIGIPEEARLYCGPGDVLQVIRKRDPDAHKGDYGRLLIVGGSRQYIGAPVIAASAAYASGVDLVTIACPSYVADRIYDPNLIINPLDSENRLRESDVEGILKIKFDAILIGNGLGTHEETREAVRNIVKKADKPIILDADALKAVKRKDLKENILVTPHASEFETLFGEYDSEKRVELAEGYARKSDAVVLLKGKIDVISDGKTTRLNRTGNPAMTVGGTGDALAGLAAGFIAQKNSLFDSACAAAFLNGLAGDFAFEKKGISLKATDVVDKIPAAIKYCQGFIR